MAAVELPRTRAYERFLALLFDRTVLVSAAERDEFAKLLQGARAASGNDSCERLVVVPNGVDTDKFAPRGTVRAPATILFSGKMSYHANIAAANFLLDEILPRVQKQIPNVRVVIAGQNPPAALTARKSANVEVTGTVSDLRPFMAAATVSCAPILYGAGVQNKILEAMAMGTAVVTTPKALTALHAQVGRDLLTGSDADGLSAALVQLMQDPVRRTALEQNGRKYVETYHSWAHSVTLLEHVYAQAIQQAQRWGDRTHVNGTT